MAGIAHAGEGRGPSSARRPLWQVVLLRPESRVVLDLAVLGASFVAAYALRFDFDVPEEMWSNLARQLPLVVALQFVALRIWGAHRFLWHLVGFGELRAFVGAAVCSALALFALRLALPDSMGLLRVPLSITLITTVLAHGGLLGLRILRRSLFEFSRARGPRPGKAERKPVLLVGAGRAGVLAAREIHGRPATDQMPIGFVDDDLLKQGAVVAGLEVLGTTEELGELVGRLRVEHVAITIAEPDPALVRRVVEACEPYGIRVQIIPGLYEILQGQVSVSRFRDVRIEDLLGRDPVRVDPGRAESFLAGKVVLVTGAGGSIGSEIARQVAGRGPRQLVLLERAEGALFAIEQELLPAFPGLDIRAVVADVGHEPRMSAVLRTYRPEVVFHAAAHKHVPMMESNPSEAVHNNALATELLGRLAGDYGVDAVVLLSTDKAVRPSSVMGASKRIAELVLEDLASRYPTRYVAVRFGNVLDSAGSVVPIFREQIRRGGPVTVTHPEATRYFMTIPEAVQLVLEAGAIGSSGDVMILDMGKPVRIVDLANAMIRLSGQASTQVEVVYTGLRPGEKLVEELELDEEATGRTVHPRIYVGQLKSHSPEQLSVALERLRTQVEAGDEVAIRETLAKVIPEANLEKAHAHSA